MLSFTLITLLLAILPLAFSLARPYYNNYDYPLYQDKWLMRPYYSVPFHPDFHRPVSSVPFFKELDGYYYQFPFDAEADIEIPDLSDDIRNNEISESAEEDIVGDTDVAKIHRQKRSPFFFGGYPSSSSAYSSSGASSFSGFGGSFSKTFSNSGASSSGGGSALASGNSNAFGASFGGFGGPSFSGSNSQSNAFAFSRPSYNPWSFFGFRGR